METITIIYYKGVISRAGSLVEGGACDAVLDIF